MPSFHKLLSVGLVLMLIIFAALTACTPGATPATSEAALIREQLGSSLQAALDQAAAEVAATAASLKGRSLSGPEARTALSALAARYPGRVEDAATIDAKGFIVAVEPAKYRAAEGADVSRAPDVQQLIRTAKPVMSGVDMSAEGFEAAAIEYPVFAADGSLSGSVSLLFKPAAFIDGVFKGHTGGADIEVWVMDLKGRDLWDKDPTQNGLNILTDPLYRDFPKLVSLCREIIAERVGNGYYDYVAPGRTQPVRKDATWTTVSLYGTEWRVIAAKLAN